MKNYDDLQRFKEKTHTLDIAFKDMSGQSQDADHSQWAIIRQLAADNEPELGSGQRIDLPQPQPIRGDEFVAPEQPAPLQAPIAAAGSTTRGSILDSLAATAPVESVPAAPPSGVSSLFPPAPAAKPAPSAIAQAPKATVVERQATTSLFPPPPPKPVAEPVAAPAPIVAAPAPIAATPAPAPRTVVSAGPVATPAPSTTFAAPAQPAAAAPSRFGALFRSRPAEPAHISKETLLKPLLEKIALCR